MSYQTPPQMSTPLPQRQQVDISAGTAFKVGFFAYFGMLCAALIVAVILGAVMLVLGVGLAGVLNS